MIRLETMVLLDQLNNASKPHGKSYALLGNRKALQLFVSTGKETVEMCHGTPNSIHGVLKTLLNATTNQQVNQNINKEENK